jgi:hypothetical protein
MAAIATLGGAPARFPGGLREVAPRTWAWLQPNGGLGESNAGLICGDGASLLVDTLWEAMHGSIVCLLENGMREELAERGSPGPQIAVINGMTSHRVSCSPTPTIDATSVSSPATASARSHGGLPLEEERTLTGVADARRRGPP